MKIFVDDGSTNIKLQWEEKGEVKRHISPNSFKREWGSMPEPPKFPA